MVARGDDVRAQVEQLFGERRRQAKAAGGIFSVDHHQADLVVFDHMRQVLADDTPPRAAKNVTHKKYAQPLFPFL